jgi:hypothetical protein
VPAGVALNVQRSDLDYLDRFLARNEPLPDLVDRPLRYPDRVPPRPESSVDPYRDLRREKFRSLMKHWDPTPPTGRIDGLELLKYLSRADAGLVEKRTVYLEDTTETELTVPYKAVADVAVSLRLSVLATGHTQKALEAFLDMLVEYTTPLTPAPELANFAFYSPADESVVALRGSLVFSLRNDPDRAVPIRSELRWLDKAIQALPILSP